MVFSFKKNSNTIILALALVIALVYFYKNREEQFCGDGCGDIGFPYPEPTPLHLPAQPQQAEQYENFSSCYRRKQIYLNSCDPDQPSNHGDVYLERRYGKLYITLNCNLPYAKGGPMNTMFGAYHAMLLDSRNNKSMNLGSLVRDGSRFYKLATELLGEYSNYDKIVVYIQTESYRPKKVLTGSISCQGISEDF